MPPAKAALPLPEQISTEPVDNPVNSCWMTSLKRPRDAAYEQIGGFLPRANNAF
jgi:hypothetical protein